MNFPKLKKMNSLTKHYLIFPIILMINTASTAQAVCAESRVVVPMQNGKEVALYSDSNGGPGNSYYYMPSDLHISEVKGKKEFLFQAYEENGTNGAIMHLLLSWDLDQEKENHITKYLTNMGDSMAVIAGNVPVEQLSNEAFSIISNNSLGQILNRSLNSKGNLPSHAGSKMALSFNFKDEDALEMQAAIRNPTKLKGTFFQLVYLYQEKKCRAFSGNFEVKELVIKKDLGELLAHINQ
jgi:hypothetical protein